ncbi:hypothetical protein F2Q69_00036665 [Brassica cretica]|uniref:Uncharacterized protein n=1 Tax=Brassica cretica TaxID=69181 RepID=A0A8S9SLS2_BRACR|nr:hypothetical protein F2Q69_00036665 [Brassica cretica]
MADDHSFYQLILRGAAPIVAMDRKLPNTHLSFPKHSSSPCVFSLWKLDHVGEGRTEVAQLIATSVTKEHRFQSYVATSGPRWLQ